MQKQVDLNNLQVDLKDLQEELKLNDGDFANFLQETSKNNQLNKLQQALNLKSKKGLKNFLKITTPFFEEKKATNDLSWRSFFKEKVASLKKDVYISVLLFTFIVAIISILMKIPSFVEFMGYNHKHINLVLLILWLMTINSLFYTVFNEIIKNENIICFKRIATLSDEDLATFVQLGQSDYVKQITQLSDESFTALLYLNIKFEQ